MDYFITVVGLLVFSENTFIDVGSNLSPYLGERIQGWKVNRGYLTHYWLKSQSPFGSQVDVWQT